MDKILTIIIVSSCFQCYSQQLSLSLSENFSGHNIRISNYFNNNNEIGIKYHLNRLNYDDGKGSAFLRTFYTKNIANRFSLFFNGKNDWKKLNESTTIYGFFNLDLNYIGRKVIGESYWTDSLGNSKMIKINYDSKPFFSSEINLGVGIRKKITRNISCFAELGVGIIYLYINGYQYYDANNQILIVYSGYNGIDYFTSQLRLGLISRIL